MNSSIQNTPIQPFLPQVSINNDTPIQEFIPMNEKEEIKTRTINIIRHTPKQNEDDDGYISSPDF